MTHTTSSLDDSIILSLTSSIQVLRRSNTPDRKIKAQLLLLTSDLYLIDQAFKQLK